MKAATALSVYAIQSLLCLNGSAHCVEPSGGLVGT